MKKFIDLANELNVLGMLDKAREIYSELGDAPAISYVRSNYRLLSKIYHPDLKPEQQGKSRKNAAEDQRSGAYDQRAA